MRRRPLCAVFLFLTILLFLMKASGIPVSGMPDEKLNDHIESLKGENCIISGKIASREEKANSISYFLKDSYLIKNIPFTDLDPDSIQNADKVPLRNIQLYISKEEPAIKIGSIVAAFGEPEPYENAYNPGGFDAADYYAADDCCMSMYASAVRTIDEPGFSPGEALARLKERLRENLNKMMRPDSAAVLSAMLFGDRSGLTEELKLDYSAAGISHILSISGMHIAIIGDFVYKTFSALRIRPKASSVMSIAVIAFYCVFTGNSEPTVRAAVMFSVRHAGRCFLRSYDPVSALSLAGIIMLAVRPMSLFRAGFQLSFAASAAITCVQPAIKRAVESRLKKELTRVKKFFLNSALMWISVNLVTFPIVLYHFFEFPVYSIITNIIFVPLTEAVMILGLAGSALGFLLPGVARAILLIPDWILYFQNAAGDIILKLPMSMLILGRPALWQMLLAFAGIVLAVICLHKGKRLVPLAAFGLVSLCAARMPEALSVTALDVGQGDCVFIRKGGYAYMVDGGSSSESDVGRYTIIPYIKSQGISVIEGIFLTHDDEDHMNGIMQMLGMVSEKEIAVKVKNFFMPGWLYENEKGRSIAYLAMKAGANVHALNAGDGVSFGDVRINVLAPSAGSYLEGNEGSLTLSVEYGEFGALLTGDLEGEGEEELKGRLGTYDYLKVAHHGSRNSGSEEFYGEVSPSLCVISAPEKSIYGHPHKETLERIKRSGADCFQTGICGAVKATVGDEKITVETYKGFC